MPNLSAPFRGGWSCISILKGHLRQRLSQLNPGLLLGMQRDGRGEQKQLGGPLGPEQGDGPLKALPEPLRQSHRFLCLWWLVGSEMNEGQEGMVRTRENEHGNPSPLKSIQSRKNRGQGVPARHTSGATLSQKLPGAPPSQESLLPLEGTPITISTRAYLCLNQACCKRRARLSRLKQPGKLPCCPERWFPLASFSLESPHFPRTPLSAWRLAWSSNYTRG